MACRILNTFWDEIAKYRSSAAVPLPKPAQCGVTLGAKMSAIADGRFAAEPLGNTMAPKFVQLSDELQDEIITKYVAEGL